MDGGAHGGEIDEQRHAGEVLQHDAGDDEGDLVIAGRLGVVVGEVFRRPCVGDLEAVVVAEQGFEHDPDGNRQAGEFGKPCSARAGSEWSLPSEPEPVVKVRSVFMLLLTRTALRHGSGVGVRMALGIATGLTLHATVAIAGMAVVFERFAVLRRALQWVAAIYLLWLAWGLLREAFSAGSKSTIREMSTRHSPFVRGLLCNLFNPKVALFLAAVCAPFLAGPHPEWWPFALWCVVVGMGAGLWSLWVMALQWRPLRNAYEHAARGIDTAFGLALAVLAVILISRG
jgi:threonine efflux protein